MERVRLRAFAKVNYALEVRGVRPDGYHEISTVMQSISLADVIEIERAESGFELVVEPEGAGIGPPEENTVYKVWIRLGERIGDALPVRVRLGKKIPAGAGLGGGSADAAATLVGLNELFGLRLGEAELRDVGLRVGTDVPFCLVGGTALGRGIGEVLSPLPTPPSHHLVVAKPAASAETAHIYGAYDEHPVGGSPSVAPVVEALRMGGLGVLAGSLGNDLALVTEDLVPEVRALEKALLRAGALGAAMSGTGTAVFGIFALEAEAWAAADGLRATFVAVCKPVSRGVEVL
ncbi:MAG: 4-diphosphocytidyl-2-C-methyl-D-erythritol kinase [uncultured Rubrobacteraceae bacterium]|uniref:4-diphosphocytidyl-2-C-methyl-D-erythritol kinase n=1 Tax=uncultured Rubrobacteraceae bacterium TaxID=349277 RepID=A0A6J4QIZ7_9ACTN|nr:MAG: 4-diphosphocytidyl-2-C-methyl-D-erythritol kinase [uncultured Rubrobacteraceae bacterium]